jgi:serine/threonine protein kinase
MFVLTVRLAGYNDGGGGSDEETHQANVLINDGRTPLLSDFGRSKYFDQRSFTSALDGSARYMAPELIMAESNADYEDDAYKALENQAPLSLTKGTDVFTFSISWQELDMADGYSTQLLWCIGVGNHQCSYKGFPPVTG